MTRLPTRVVVRTRRPAHYSSILVFIATWIIVGIIIAFLLRVDPYIQHDWAWVVAGLLIMLTILEGTTYASKLKSGKFTVAQDRVVRAIRNVGLQLETRVGEKKSLLKGTATPILLPFDSIHAIYVHEHIEVARVTSHVMIAYDEQKMRWWEQQDRKTRMTGDERDVATKNQTPAPAATELKLTPAFPGCTLPHKECCRLKNEIVHLLQQHQPSKTR
mmetsp:Transcript_1020/g.2415  ORF Transcript_1020/g.2415 Transcript_1020/m.2415 type:complete len:217 (+) Transcript_1020:256-906(+)